MRLSRIALAAWLACAAGLLLTGCSNNKDVVLRRFAPTVLAATAADSVAAGQPLVVKVHWRASNSCQSFSKFNFNPVNDSTFDLITMAVETIDPNQTCTSVDRIVEASYRFEAPPARHFTVQVYGAAQRLALEVQGGAAPAAVERHRVLVDNAAGGGPVAGAIARVIAVPSLDTLATIVTGADGAGEATLPCAGTRAYKLWVTGASGRQAMLEFQPDPAVCGVPERTRILF